MTTRSKLAPTLAMFYFALATASLVWPIYPWIGNRIEPRLLGLPFSLVWVLAVITSNFVVLVVCYRLRLIDAEEYKSEGHGEGNSEVLP